MKNTAATVIAFVAFAITATGQSDKAVEKSQMQKDEAAISANVRQMERGWNMRSGFEFATPFASDSDYVVVNGMHLKGQAANAAAHQQIFDTVYRNSTLKLTLESVRFLRDDVAIVHLQGTLLVDRADPATGHDSRATMVMKKAGGRWQIAAFHNTPIQGGPARGEK